MTEKRFVLAYEKGNEAIFEDRKDVYPKRMTNKEVENRLNEQESTITSLKERNKQLRRRLEKINGGYGHLTHRNGLTANEWVIESQEKELIKKNEQISDWIERHSKDIVKIGEQQTTIRELKEEMVRLHKMSIELMDRVIPNLRRENEQLRQEIERLKKPILKDNQETEVKECQFCGEFRTEYHEYEDYSWSAEDYCNAGHDLEDTDPNSCKDYWDK